MAIVVADTAHAAQDALELIAVEYGTLPAVADARAALAPGAPCLHDDVPGNLCFDFDYGDPAATEAAFARAAHVVRLEQESGRVVGNPMEPKAALASWDGSVLELWSASQGMTGMRDGLAALTGLPPAQIRVHAQDVGGAFGIRGPAYPEYAALALAAKQVGRPVKWVASRSETFLSDYHGRAVSMAAELALDADGHFLAIRHDWVCDIGAHPSAAGPGTNTLNASLMAAGAYRIPAVYGRKPAGRHQHRPHHRLSRRRAAGHGLHGRAPGGRGGAADRDRPAGTAAPQPDPARGLSLPDQHRAHAERL